MAKKVVDPRATALEALSRALTDPAPKIAFGSAKVPGFFSGSTQAVKDAFKVCVESGWLEPTGERAGKGAAAKEKYRITAHGISAVLEASEPLDLLRGLAGSLKNQVDALHAIQENVGLALKKRGPACPKCPCVGEPVSAAEPGGDSPKAGRLQACRPNYASRFLIGLAGSRHTACRRAAPTRPLSATVIAGALPRTPPQLPRPEPRSIPRWPAHAPRHRPNPPGPLHARPRDH